MNHGRRRLSLQKMGPGVSPGPLLLQLDRLVAAVARLVYEPTGLKVEPVALWSEGTPRGDVVLNPSFDLGRIQSRHSALLERLRAKYGRNMLNAAMQADEDENDWLLPAAPFPPELEKRISEMESLFLSWAERGTRRMNDADRCRLQSIAHHLAQTGLDWLSQNLAALESSPSVGHALLWCVYLLRTYRQAQLRSCLDGHVVV
jgi:hypothetical protein